MSTLTAAPIADLIAQARDVHAATVQIEDAIRRDYNALLCAGWHLGKILVALKEHVGHSRWLIWLAGHLPELAGDDGRPAQKRMALYNANPSLSNPSNLTDFAVDSVRAFLGGYLPAKIRPQLEGNERLAPVATFDSGTNRFSAYFQRIKSGHVRPAPLDQVAPQVRLIIEGLREIYGRESIDNLLA